MQATFSTPALTESSAVLTVEDRARALSEKTEGCGCCSVQVLKSSGRSPNSCVRNKDHGLSERWRRTGSLTEVVWGSTKTSCNGVNCCVNGTRSGLSCKVKHGCTNGLERGREGLLLLVPWPRGGELSLGVGSAGSGRSCKTKQGAQMDKFGGGRHQFCYSDGRVVVTCL